MGAVCPLACWTALLTAAAAGERIEYPHTRRVEQVDEYFGVKVPDPYRWLEQDMRTSPEVADWVAAENKVTCRYLESIPAAGADPPPADRAVELRPVFAAHRRRAAATTTSRTTACRTSPSST